MSLSIELIELIRAQDLASGRAYPHVHIAFVQSSFAFLSARSRCAAKVDAIELIVPADQISQLRVLSMRDNHRQNQKQKKQRDDQGGTNHRLREN
jgi:hypothetical protein